MKEVQINDVVISLVEVPADAVKFKISGTGFICYLTDSDRFTWHPADETPLKKGTVLIGKASSLSEQDWQAIAENEFDTWLNYLEDERLGSYYLTTAKESGYSLLELHGFKPETTLILKRKA